jgi:hypothetical protein
VPCICELLALSKQGTLFQVISAIVLSPKRVWVCPRWKLTLMGKDTFHRVPLYLHGVRVLRFGRVLRPAAVRHVSTLDLIALPAENKWDAVERVLTSRPRNRDAMGLENSHWRSA